jgi:hypothetical protein
VLLNAVGTTAFAALLWSRHRVIPQQVAMMVGAMIVAGAVIADFVTTDGLPGAGVWGVAVVWLLLGWGGLLRPRRAVVAFGAVGALVGAMITMADDAGIAFAMGTAAAIVVTAVLMRDLVLLVVGGVGALQVLPTALTRWFPDSQAAPFGLLGLGALLVGVALWTARRRVRRPDAARATRDYSAGRPEVALRAAAVVAVVVTGTVLVIALV